MKITAMEISEGAEASMKVGDVVNFSFPQTIKVTNGDAFLEYVQFFYGGIFFCDNRVGRNSIYTIGWRFGVQKTLGA